MQKSWTYENRENVITVPVKATQTVVETEETLRGGLREAAKVFYAGADASIRHAQLNGSRIHCDGRIRFQVLYAQGDMSKIIPLEVTADFQQGVQAPDGVGENAGAEADIHCTVMDVNARVHNGRIALEAIVQLEGNVTMQKNVRCLKMVENEDRICEKKAHLTLSRKAGSGEVQSTVRDEMELSDILQVKETLIGSACAIVEDVKQIGKDKVAVMGTVLLDVCHQSDMPRRPLIRTQHKVPFEQEIALSGSGSMVSARSSVRDVAVVSQDTSDGNGEKVMRCEVVVHTVVQAIHEEETEILEDAYAVSGHEVHVEQEQAAFVTAYICEEKAESGRLNCQLPEGAPRMKEALLAFPEPVLLRKRKSGNRLQVDGVMRCTILYTADDQEAPESQRVEVPFTSSFITDADQFDRVQLHVSEPSVSAITGDRAEIKYILHMTATGERRKTLSFATDAAMGEEKAVMHGASICFVQQGETLWDVGKRYGIRTDVLEEENGIADHQVATGDALIIFGAGELQKQHVCE